MGIFRKESSRPRGDRRPADNKILLAMRSGRADSLAALPGNEAVPVRVAGGLGAVGDTRFGEDVAYVAGNSVGADNEAVGDLPIASASGNQAKDFDLAFREASG
jgi:hypothetical protein